MAQQKVLGELKELKSITHEIKKRNEELKTFRARKKEIEASVMIFLQEEEQPGVKYEDIVNSTIPHGNIIFLLFV